MKCPHCEKDITRKQGNLNFRSWQAAIKALWDKHVAKCAASK